MHIKYGIFELLNDICLQISLFEFCGFEVYVIDLKEFSQFWEDIQNSYSVELIWQAASKGRFFKSRTECFCRCLDYQKESLFTNFDKLEIFKCGVGTFSC